MNGPYNMRSYFNFDELNLESIAMKESSKSFDVMENLFQYLKDDWLMLKFQTNNDIINLKIYKEKFKELEDVLYEETGIQYKFYSTNAMPHCIVPPGPASNIINHASAEISTAIRNIMRRYKIRPDNKAEEIKALNSNKDIINLYATIGKSMAEIEKSYFDKSVRVDFKKGKIEGLNKDVVVFIGIPFIQLFKANFTVKEIMAITYHEIGHGFNSMAYMHQYFTTVNTTIEALYEAKNEKEVIDSYNNIIAIDGRKVKDIKEMFYDLFSESDKTNGNVYAIKNNESMADQFAVRYNLGQDLVTALARLTGNLEGTGNKPDHKDIINVVIYFARSLACIVGMIVLMPLYIWLIVVIGIPVLIIMMLARIGKASIATGITDPNELTDLMLDTNSIYDDLEQRFRRVKLDLIRNLKDHKVKNKSNIMKQIKVIEELIEKVEEDRTTFTNLKYIFTMKRKAVGISDFYMAVEELTENDLHVQNEAFKRIFK